MRKIIIIIISVTVLLVSILSITFFNSEMIDRIKLEKTCKEIATYINNNDSAFFSCCKYFLTNGAPGDNVDIKNSNLSQYNTDVLKTYCNTLIIYEDKLVLKCDSPVYGYDISIVYSCKSIECPKEERFYYVNDNSYICWFRFDH